MHTIRMNNKLPPPCSIPLSSWSPRLLSTLLSWGSFISSLLLALQRVLTTLQHVMWGGIQRHGGENGLPTEAEHSLLRQRRGEAAWAAIDVTSGGHVKPQDAQKQNALSQPNEFTHRGSLQTPSKRPRLPFLPPRPHGCLCVLWLLELQHMTNSTFVASQGLYCDEVSQVVVAGTGSTGSANGVGLSASFNYPYGISTSPDGNFYRLQIITITRSASWLCPLDR